MEKESRVDLQVVFEARQAGQREKEGYEGAGGHENDGGVNGGGTPALHPDRLRHLLLSWGQLYWVPWGPAKTLEDLGGLCAHQTIWGPYQTIWRSYWTIWVCLSLFQTTIEHPDQYHSGWMDAMRCMSGYLWSLVCKEHLIVLLNNLLLIILIFSAEREY